VIPGLVPPELIVAAVTLALLGGLVWALVREGKRAAAARDDRDEAQAATEAQRRGLEAAAREAQRVDDL